MSSKQNLALIAFALISLLIWETAQFCPDIPLSDSKVRQMSPKTPFSIPCEIAFSKPEQPDFPSPYSASLSNTYPLVASGTITSMSPSPSLGLDES